jgi:transposase-like protein
MGKIFPQVAKPRIPDPSDGIQVNYCKNPKCKNYGRPAKPKVSRGKVAAGKKRLTDVYTVNASGWDMPVLHCKECGESPPMKSNVGIAQELDRFKSLLAETDNGCQNPECENFGVSLRAKKRYQKFGTTASGDPRYRCKACGKTFSVGPASRRHRRSEKNKLIFMLAVNKTPIRRMCEIAELQAKYVYKKLDFLHTQCVRFLAARERRLLTSVHPKQLHLSVDRQDHFGNWLDRNIKKNIVFQAIGTADNITGYVFASHLNYDPTLTHEVVEKEARDCGDLYLPVAFRQHARLWLGQDYLKAMYRTAKRNNKDIVGDTLLAKVMETYKRAGNRPDVEDLEAVTASMQLPKNGVQVRADYTMYGHFFYLAHLFRKVGRIRFYLDQESGIRAACLSAFMKRVKNRTCDAFYVSINKDMTNDEREQCVKVSRKRFKKFKERYPGLPDNEVIKLMVKRNMKSMKQIGQYKDLWLEHPYPNKSEPEKMVSYQTDLGDYDEDLVADMYMRASLAGIDRFFMQSRRRSSYLERGIHTSSRSGGVWHGYAPYDPRMIGKSLDMLRFFYNYVQVGKNKETPAMRLGLADGPVKVEDLLYE